MELKPGYRRYIARELLLGKYSFFQLESGKTGSIALVVSEHPELKKNYFKLLNINFDPADDSREFWGYPTPSLQMTLVEWEDHCQKADKLLTEAGGIKLFREMPFQERFFNREGREVTAEEALADSTG